MSSESVEVPADEVTVDRSELAALTQRVDQLESEKQRQAEETERLRALESRLDAQSTQMDSLREALHEKDERIDELEGELQQRDERIDELETELGRLDSRTDMLNLVQSSDEMDGEQRSTALIQHLHKAAQKQCDRGQPAMASVNREEAERALQFPDVERTTIYQDLKRAVRHVGNEDVLWYEKSTGGDSRLKLNLKKGELPLKFTGDQ